MVKSGWASCVRSRDPNGALTHKLPYCMGTRWKSVHAQVYTYMYNSLVHTHTHTQFLVSWIEQMWLLHVANSITCHVLLSLVTKVGRRWKEYFWESLQTPVRLSCSETHIVIKVHSPALPQGWCEYPADGYHSGAGEVFSQKQRVPIPLLFTVLPLHVCMKLVAV